MNRCIIVHGWGDYPQNDWLPWLKNELEAHGFSASIPALPNPNEPKIEAWVTALAKAVGTIDEQTYLVGHSIGCQTILRFLEKSEGKAKGVLLVAPWLSGIAGLTPEELIIATPWIETLINYTLVKTRADQVLGIFSDNDPYVPLSEAQVLKQQLGAKTQIVHHGGHFAADDNCTELPEALDAVLDLSGTK